MRQFLLCEKILRELRKNLKHKIQTPVPVAQTQSRLRLPEIKLKQNDSEIRKDELKGIYLLPKMIRYDFFLRSWRTVRSGRFWEALEIIGDSRRPRRFKEARDVPGDQEGPGDSGRPLRFQEAREVREIPKI